ncbi:hypothetical protein VTN02DRAFT_6227 [Thermoascus thermophilus]
MGNQSPPPPSRRFLPQPVETSSRSFRHRSLENPKSSTRISSDERSPVDDGPPRMPSEPSSHGDSENPTGTVSCPPPGAVLRQTQTMSTGRKRFLPQPTETFTRSSKDRWTSPGSAGVRESSRSVYTLQPAQTASNASAVSASQSARRSLPQPIETVSVSSKPVADQLPGKSAETHLAGPSKGLAHETSGNGPSVRRFFPEPIESVKWSNRKDASSSDGAKKDGSSSPPLRTAPRKFAPQLIETAKRSFRRGEATSALTASTDAELPSGQRRLPRFSSSSAVKSDGVVPQPQESRFSYASLVRRQERRRHSFRVPGLPAIPSQSSEGSDGSNVPSLSTSPSTSSDEGAKRSKIRDQRQESCDEPFPGYLLSLAARSAEKQLRDQALAAFPNEQVYQPVSHFAIDREEEDPEDEEDGVGVVFRDSKDDIAPFRRESTADLPWELEQMRRHKEMAETRNRAKGENLSESRFSAAAIAARRALNGAEPAVSSNIIDGWQKGIGLTQMAHAASPPMLGEDLVFPQSLSPQSTRCDIDHAPVPREETSSKGCDNCGGLWCVNPHVDDDCAGGLWMGTCRKVNDAGRPSTKASRPGIITPTTAHPDDQSHLSSNSVAASQQNSPLPTTYQEADPHLDDVDRKLSLEEEIDREFHDGFVTQIYNYLSLGYPCLARYYDDELSRISGIPVEELRRDDSQTDAKGYVGAPEGAGVGEEGVTGGKCMRWTALRLYIREWARQQPRMSGSDGNLKTWGVRERRGSWAI